ncbi:MAG: hypothetical protein HKN76_15665 [Saprospiraceae bacterium]|nr:hypothetical protein [Saprospiraceae bacterium]
MLKYLFLLLLFFHGLIHTLGFFKAFQIMEISQLTKDINRPQGILWLITFALFICSAILFLLRHPNWFLITLLSVVISQGLIINSWSDAKYGTVANIIILIAATISYGHFNLTNRYQEDVSTGLVRTSSLKEEILEERDLLHLPEIVQKYLRYSGVINKPKVYNAKILLEGQMRGRDQDWFQFESEQYNFFDQPSRFFLMQAKVKGFSTYGYHRYKNTKASMLIKLLGLFPVVNHDGAEMDTAETVTLFNEMCLMAPATLITKNIVWKTIDSHSVTANFTNDHITVSATLYFNDAGQLIDFQSEDRYEVADMQRYPFSTPIGKYQARNGYNLFTFGEAIWHYPDGDFTYGKFDIKSIEYNVTE